MASRLGVANVSSGFSQAAYKGMVEDVAPHNAIKASSLFFITLNFRFRNSDYAVV